MNFEKSLAYLEKSLTWCVKQYRKTFLIKFHKKKSIRIGNSLDHSNHHTTIKITCSTFNAMDASNEMTDRVSTSTKIIRGKNIENIFGTRATLRKKWPWLFHSSSTYVRLFWSFSLFTDCDLEGISTKVRDDLRWIWMAAIPIEIIHCEEKIEFSKFPVFHWWQRIETNTKAAWVNNGHRNDYRDRSHMHEIDKSYVIRDNVSIFTFFFSIQHD